VGTVRNETDYTLTGVAIILGNRFVHLGDLSPGEKVPVTINMPDLASQRFGPSMGWRLFQDQLNQSGPGGLPREAQLKQTVVDIVFQGSWGLVVRGGFGDSRSLSLAGEGRARLGLELLGWLDEAPPDVQVAGREPAQQTTALLYTTLSYALPDEGDFSLPPGLILGTLVEVPVAGGPCGPNATSVHIGRGQAVFEFQVSGEVRDVQVDALKLVIGTNDGWAQPPDTAVYDWDAETWAELGSPVMGVNVFSDADGLVSDDGLVRVRLSSEGSSGGCIYVELGLEGTR
jgi:hypothetical protein